MAQSVFGAQAVVTMLNRAFNNSSPGNAVYGNQVAAAGATEASQFAFARTFANSFSALTDAALAERVLGNLGVLPNAELLQAMTDYLGANAKAERGVIVLQAAMILANLEGATGSLAIYAPAAVAWNAEVERSFLYSSNTANTTTFVGEHPDTAASGQTFTLTTSVDTTISGGTGDDTITGTVNYSGGALASTTTYNAGDMIKGGAGNDAFDVTVSGADIAADTLTPTMTGIEVVRVQNYETDATAGDNITVDLSLADSSLATVGTTVSTNANAGTSFTNIGKSVALTMAGKGNMTVGYATGVNAGSADAATVTLNGVGTSATTVAALDVSSIETLNLVSATAANYVSVANRAVTSIAVSGAQAVKVDVLDVDVTAFDASAATGAVTADLDAITLANLRNVKGGAGTSDVLEIDEAVTVTGSTAATNSLFYVSGFETVKVTGAAVGVALTTNGSGVTKWNFDDAATQQTLTLNAGYDQATTVKLGDTDDVTDSAGVALTVNIDSDDLLSTNAIAAGTGATDTSDVINVTAKGGTSVISAVTGVETINILAGSAGDEDVTMNVGAADGTVASGKTLAVNAAALTNSGARLDFTGTGETDGSFNVTGGAGNDSIVGGSANDTIVGGAHNDTIDGAAGNDSISGDAGNDSITAGAGNDYVSGGDGDDTIIFAANLDTNDTVVGGAGNDTLSVTSISVSALTNVTEMENLKVTGASNVSLSANLSFTTIDASDDTGAQAVTFATGYTAATTVKLGATSTNNDSVVNSANVALTVDVTDAGMLDSGVTLTGGTGTDTLLITADATDTADFTNVTAFDVVTVRDGDVSGEDITLALGSYATALSINASALNGSDEQLIVNGGSATKNLSVVGGSGNDSITAGAGNDSIEAGAQNDTIVAGGGNDKLDGGDGNDLFTLAGNLTYQDTIVGGAGTDTLDISGTVVDSSFLAVTGVEKVGIADTGNVTFGAYSSAGGVTTAVVAAGATVNAAGHATGLTVEAITAAGTVDVTGGAGNDTFIMDATGTYTNADAFVGGTGTDTLQVNNDTSDAGTTGNAVGSADLELDFTATASVERVYVKDTATDDAAGDVALKFHSTYAQATLIIDASELDAGETLTIDQTNGTVANVDAGETLSIVGGGGDDSLYGGADNDTIAGGAGADLIHGGAGGDSLTGGAGNDDFVFRVTTNGTTSLDSAGSKVDTVTDFTAGSDNLRVEITASAADLTYDFTDKGDVASAADAIALMAGKVGQYVFNTTTKQVMFDTTGNGLLQATDLAVTLTGAATINEADVDVKLTLGQNGTNTVTTGAGNDTVVGGTGADTVVLGAGNDTVSDGGTTADSINAGAGDDQISIAAASSVDGGTGNDTVTVTADVTAPATFTGVESIVLSGDGTDLTIDRTQLTGITSVTGNTAAATVEYLKVASAAAGTTSVSSITFTNAAASITGNAGNDSIVGGSGADIIATNGGNDTVTGGAGADAITLGGGNDKVVFSATNGADTIGAFAAAGTDTLDFTAFLGASAAVQTTAVAIGTGLNMTAGSKTVGVVFNKGTLATGDVVVATDTNAVTGKVSIADNGKAVILVNADADGTGIATDGSSNWNVYYVEDTNTATNAQTFTVTLVGTIATTGGTDTAAEAAAAALFV